MNNPHIRALERLDMPTVEELKKENFTLKSKENIFEILRKNGKKLHSQKK